MKKSGKKLIVCLLIFFVIPALAVSIASFVIAGQNLNTTCDIGDNSLMRLSTWLFINGGVSLGLLVIYGTLFFLSFTQNQYVYLVLFIIIYLINWGFVITWNVFGAVQLFEHSDECKSQANSLWVMTLVALIFQWLSIFLVCCIKNTAKNASF